VTICAKEHALFQFAPNPFPTSCMSSTRDSKILARTVQMMEFERFGAFAVAANLALPAEIVNRFLSNFPASLLYCFDEILAAISVFASFNRLAHTSFHSRLLYH
jgi:hypothetical protein